MLTWPHAHGDWRPWLAQVEPVFTEIARQIARRERVLIVCHDAEHRDHVQDLLKRAGVDDERIRLPIAPSNDSWARDHGPIAVMEPDGPRLLDFRFNAWGGKYAADLDDAIARRLHEAGAFGATPMTRVDLVLEGGGIEVDGAGTLLATTRCLLSKTRNPRLKRTGMESWLSEWLGVDRFLWLEHGYLAGDDTDSHVDTLARFCDPRTLAYIACDDPDDEHYTALKTMESELRVFRTRDNEPYRLIPLPWPRAKLNENGERLPATYANFLIINGAVLVPTYDDPADAAALARLQSCFPERDVVAIPCTPLLLQYGSLHCVTMQLPAGVLR